MRDYSLLPTGDAGTCYVCRGHRILYHVACRGRVTIADRPVCAECGAECIAHAVEALDVQRARENGLRP